MLLFFFYTKLLYICTSLSTVLKPFTAIPYLACAVLAEDFCLTRTSNYQERFAFFLLFLHCLIERGTASKQVCSRCSGIKPGNHQAVMNAAFIAPQKLLRAISRVEIMSAR
jgi:hypothetical protein